jgi:hypothetical protein
MGGALHAMARPYGFVLVSLAHQHYLHPSVQFFLDLKDRKLYAGPIRQASALHRSIRRVPS